MPDLDDSLPYTIQQLLDPGVGGTQFNLVKNQTSVATQVSQSVVTTVADPREIRWVQWRIQSGSLGLDEPPRRLPSLYNTANYKTQS